MQTLFIMDPLGSINIKKDTSFALMLEAQRRGWRVSWCTHLELGADASGVYADTREVKVQHVIGDHFSTVAEARRRLSDFRVVWMRTDPPVDMDYIYATHLLDLVDPEETLVLNRPTGLRAANEKTFILHFPDVTPKTLVTRSRVDVEAFVREVGGKAIIKPLDRMGGTGIFRLTEGDPNLGTILESSLDGGRELVMVQEFVPDAAIGDKRVMLLDGEPLGAILRVPQGSDFRGNLAAGGRAEAATVTDRDLEIVARVRDRLRAEGLVLVGLDIIGGRLTEVNVTSPTGVPEINALCGLALEPTIFAWVEARVGSP